MDAKKPAAVSDPPRSEKESRARPDSTNDVKANKKIKKAPRAEEITYPVKPNTIHVVRGKKSVVNHTYRDFSNVPPAVPYTMPKAVEDRSFPENLYCLLSEKKQYSSQAIEWCSHGRAFRILNRDFLEKYGLLKLYFGFNSFKKFVKRLNDNDFRKLTTGPDKECFYSEFLLLGLPHLLAYSPVPTTRRPLLPDPNNEPDLSAIARLFPLPHQQGAIEAEAKADLASRGIAINEDIHVRWPLPPAPTVPPPEAAAVPPNVGNRHTSSSGRQAPVQQPLMAHSVGEMASIGNERHLQQRTPMQATLHGLPGHNNHHLLNASLLQQQQRAQMDRAALLRQLVGAPATAARWPPVPNLPLSSSPAATGLLNLYSAATLPSSVMNPQASRQPASVPSSLLQRQEDGVTAADLLAWLRANDSSQKRN